MAFQSSTAKDSATTCAFKMAYVLRSKDTHRGYVPFFVFVVLPPGK